MNRINAIYSFINEDDKVVDVGCDQAKLGLMLSNRKQYSIASDISENVIDRARHDIGNNKYIDLRVSDGLSNIKEGDADTLVLSGMGSYTIIKILSNTSLRFKKIITISNNYHDYLRSNMNKLNYKVKEELIVKENNRYYNLIVFDSGNREYNESELYFGCNHIDKEMYHEYLDYLYNKYLNILKLSNNSNDKINKLLELIKNNI